MFAYLLAGAIVGVLAWVWRHGPTYPRLATLVVFGMAGGVVAGLVTNLLRDDGVDDISRLGFTVAALAALVVVAGVHVRVHRDGDDEA
jgi:uncharacterized membrane protein YfcA